MKSNRAICPNCHHALKPGALSCPECGADENTGWKVDADSEHPDLASFDEEDYAEQVEKEFGSTKLVGRQRPWVPIVAASLFALLVLVSFVRCAL